MKVDITDLHDATQEAWEALDQTNEATRAEEFVFRLGSVPSRFERNDAGQLIAASLNRDRMRYRLNGIGSFGKWIERNGQTIWACKPHAPMDLVSNMLATPNLPLPVVERVVEVPVLTRDGRVHQKPGYSEAARVFYEPEPDLAVPRVSAKPSKAEVARAKELILDELLGDFKFVTPSDKAHAVALALLPFVRNLITGPTPLHSIEAPLAGTGKGLLADVALWAAMGHEIKGQTEGENDAEWRKKITAALVESPAVVLWDNLQDKLKSPALASALTQTVWSDRTLGVSQLVHVPILCAWVATANNPRMSNEMVRRTVRIRIDSELEHPEDRTEFKHPYLREWAAARRGDLVWACLTLGMAWCAAGGVGWTETRLGSYESWSSVMGGILDVVAIPGFLGNLADLRASAESDKQDIAAVLSAWHAAYQDRVMQVKELPHEILNLMDLDPRKDPAKMAGRWCASNKDVPAGGLVLRRKAGSVGGAALWFVKVV